MCGASPQEQVSNWGYIYSMVLIKGINNAPSEPKGKLLENPVNEQSSLH